MAIDSTLLMYRAFQECRHGGEAAGPIMAALRAVLARVREVGTLWLAESEPCLANGPWPPDLDGHPRWSPPSGQETRAHERGLTQRNQRLFDVIECATHDLARLCAAGAHLAVRNLGYALHPLPALLATPEEFSRKHFGFSMQFIAFCWADLSEDFKLRLCRLLDLDRARCEATVHQKGFARSMFRA